MRRNAFTMSEVLVTLGIIGVVASLTLPTIVQGIQGRELYGRLRTTYSELNQVSQRFYAENEIPFSEWASRKSVDEYAKEFMSYYKGSRRVSSYTYADGNAAVSGKMPYVIRNMGGIRSSTIICDDGGFWNDASGKLYFFNNPPNPGENGPVFCVDINGMKKPNTWGKDIFVFQFTQDGLVIPMGQEHKFNPIENKKGWETQFFFKGPERCSPYATHPELDVACAYYALQNVSPKSSNKTYWGDFVK